MSHSLECADLKAIEKCDERSEYHNTLSHIFIMFLFYINKLLNCAFQICPFKTKNDDKILLPEVSKDILEKTKISAK